jgi:hypothetical protein
VLLGPFLIVHRRSNGWIQFCIQLDSIGDLCSFQSSILMPLCEMSRVVICSRESILTQASLQQIRESDSLGSHQICRPQKHVFLNYQSTRLDLAGESAETRLDSVFSQKQRDSCIVYVGKVVYPI